MGLSLNSVGDFLTFDKMHRQMTEVCKTKYFGENKISRSVNLFSSTMRIKRLTISHWVEF